MGHFPMFGSCSVAMFINYLQLQNVRASSFKLQASSFISLQQLCHPSHDFPHDYDELGIKYLTGAPQHNLTGAPTIGSIGYQESIGCLGKGDEIGKKGKGWKGRPWLPASLPALLASHFRERFWSVKLLNLAPKFRNSHALPQSRSTISNFSSSSLHPFLSPLLHPTLVSFVSLSAIDNSRSLPGVLPPIHH